MKYEIPELEIIKFEEKNIYTELGISDTDPSQKHNLEDMGLGTN